MADDRYFDREGREIDYERWSQLYGDPSYKQLAVDRIGDLQVVAEWVGLDGGSRGVMSPFEVTVYDGDGADVESVGYATESAARDGHRVKCAQLRLRHQSF